MHDALAVRRIESIGYLSRVTKSFRERQRTADRLPFDVLHDQIVRADIVEMADMRMIERGDRARFTLETFAELALAHLDRHGAIEPAVTRLVNFTHATDADESDDFVRTEASSSRKRHGF